MPGAQELHPDQQAVLQLVLGRDMDYDGLADALGLPVELVRDRALDAVDGLAPEDVAGLTMTERERISDYLLGQQSAIDRQNTRELLDASAPGRAWARTVAGGLRPLAGDRELPTVPGDGDDVHEAFAALDSRRTAESRHGRRTRLGSALVLLGVAVVIALIVLVATGSFSGSGGEGSADVATTPSPTTTDASAQAAEILSGIPAQVNLNPPASAQGQDAKTRGVVKPALSQGKPVLALQGSGFRRPTRRWTYGIWLTGGKQPPVVLNWFSRGPKIDKGTSRSTVDSHGDVAQVAVDLTVKDPKTGKSVTVDPRQYSTFRVTREEATGKTASKPGPTILEGALHPKG